MRYEKCESFALEYAQFNTVLTTRAVLITQQLLTHKRLTVSQKMCNKIIEEFKLVFDHITSQIGEKPLSLKSQGFRFPLTLFETFPLNCNAINTFRNRFKGFKIYWGNCFCSTE